MNSVLRPLRLGEILDQTAQLYRRNFLLFAGIAMIPAAIICGISAIIGLAVALPAIKSGMPIQHNPAFSRLFLLLTLIATPILAVPAVFSQAGLTRAAIDAFRGRKMTIREALGDVRPRFWRYLGLMFLQGLVVGGIPVVCAGIVIGALAVLTSKAGGAGAFASGALVVCIFIAAVIVVFLLLTEYSMALAACMAEDKPAWAALKRSRAMSKGTRGRIFVMFLVVWCMLLVLSMIAYIPGVILLAIVGMIGHGSQHAVAMMIMVRVFSLLLNLSLQTLILPAFMIALVMFYFDQRVRLEGYDIEWMMEQAGLSAPAAAMVPGAIAGIPAAEVNQGPAQGQ